MAAMFTGEECMGCPYGRTVVINGRVLHYSDCKTLPSRRNRAVRMWLYARQVVNDADSPYVNRRLFAGMLLEDTRRLYAELVLQAEQDAEQDAELAYLAKQAKLDADLVQAETMLQYAKLAEQAKLAKLDADLAKKAMLQCAELKVLAKRDVDRGTG
jgi:hypothetical protein